MVDEGRVARLLRDVSACAQRLRDAAATAEAERGDLWLDAVKHLFITAIEGCIDVAQHIASAERWEAPDSNGEAIRLLARHDVIDPELAASVAAAVGFRNVLVHRYIEVDDTRVLDALDELGDLDAFVTQVSAWLLRSDS